MKGISFEESSLDKQNLLVAYTGNRTQINI